MSKKILFKEGGALGADGRPLLWEISGEPALSEPLYVFVPGVSVLVSDSDAAWFLDPANTRGRVFVAVKGASDAASATAVIPPSAASAPGGDAFAPVLDRAPELASFDKPKPTGAAGGR